MCKSLIYTTALILSGLRLEQFHIKTFLNCDCVIPISQHAGAVCRASMVREYHRMNFNKHCQQQAPVQKPCNCIKRMLYLTEDHLAAASLGRRASGQSQALTTASRKGKRVHVCICLCCHPCACPSKP